MRGMALVRTCPLDGAVYFEGKDIHGRTLQVRRGPSGTLVVEADDEVDCDHSEPGRVEACGTTHLDIIGIPDAQALAFARALLEAVNDRTTIASIARVNAGA